MGKSDALSRRPDHGDGTNDNDNLVLLKPDLFAIRALEGVTVTGAEAEIVVEIRAKTKVGVREHLPGSSINQLPQKGTMSELVLTAHWHYIWRSRVSPDSGGNGG